jgi:peptide/nickel transport system permease protein
VKKYLWRFEFWMLGGIAVLALLQDLLANGRPLYCRIDGQSYFPGLRTLFVEPQKPFGQPRLDSIRIYNLWKTYPYEAVLFAPIPFSPGEYLLKPSMDSARPGQLHTGLPYALRHWLGSDNRGRDVAAGLVSGARIALLTGTAAMAMAAGIGLILGALAGFWGDDRLRVSRGRFWMTLLGLFVAWFYVFIAPIPSGTDSGFAGLLRIFTFAALVLAFNLAGRLLRRIPMFAKTFTFPADLLVMRAAEVFNSVPRLVLIVAIAAMMPKKQSIWLLIALIGAFGWTGVAVFVRAELLRIRELDYVTAARGLGLSDLRILTRHALPNALRPALIAFAFGMAGAILLESALSFLGFGGEAFQGLSWGSLLANARENPEAWWVALPPGLAICGTVLALNRLGDRLNEV